VTATKTGTGSFLPLTFVTSSIERLRIDTSGNVNIPTAGARITGDFSGVTLANRLMFQTSTTNGNSQLGLLPNGTATSANFAAHNASDPTNASRARIQISLTQASFESDITGTGTYLPMTFYTGGSERVRVDTSGNVGIGTASPVNKVDVSGGNFGFRAAAQARFYRPDNGNYAIIDNPSNYLRLSQSGGDDVIVTTSGNVGIGTTSPSQLVEASLSQNGKTQVKVTNVNAGANTSAGVLFGTSSGDNGYIGANGGAASSAIGGANAVQVTNLTANPVVLATNNTERMRIDSSGNIVAGASAALATNATNGFLYVPTCAGTPTGVPTAITGMAPIVVNTTNNKLYFYSGGAWRDAGP
jgi:hypothetical protein